MSHQTNGSIIDRIHDSRDQWFEDVGHCEVDVLMDKEGLEYVFDVVDMEHNQDGGIYERKLYLPLETTLRLLEHEA